MLLLLQNNQGTVVEGKQTITLPDSNHSDLFFPLNEPTRIVDLNASVNLEMIWVEPGTFTMGSPASEVGRNALYETERNVTLTQGFYLGKYEVTQAQYEAVMKGNMNGLSAKRKPSQDSAGSIRCRVAERE